MHIELDTPTAYGLNAKYWDIVATTLFQKKVSNQDIAWDVNLTLGLWLTLEGLESRSKPIHTIPIQMIFNQDTAPTRDELFHKLMESNIKTTVNPTSDPKTGVNPEYTEELNVFPLGDFTTVGFQVPNAILVIS